MLASVLSVMALAALQPEDGPMATAVPEVAAEAPQPAAEEPATEAPAKEEPAAAKAEGEKPTPPQLTFQPETKVDGETLQVILGQRALFRLDDAGLPVLAKVEEGQLAAAHPDGAVQEAFEAPPEGQLAAALDGSAEKRASVLKVWNGGAEPVEFRVMALVLRKDKLTPVALKVCPVAPGQARTESWPAPIVAVGLARFKPAAEAADCKQGGS